MKISKNNTFTLLLLSLSISIFSSCAKVRPAEWPTGLEEDIFEISELKNALITLTLDNQIVPQSTPALVPQARSEENKFLVTETSVSDERLKSMFGDLQLPGTSGASYKIKLSVDKQFITASKVMTASEAAQLSTLESQIVSIEKDGTALLPIFQYSVLKMGVVERVKNDYKEDTKTLRLKETEPDQATHVMVSTLSNKRKTVQVSAQLSDTYERLFLADKIHGKVFSDTELTKMFNIPSLESGHYLADISSNKLSFLKVAKLSSLSKELQDALKSNSNNELSNDVSACPAEVIEQIEISLKDDCALVLTLQSGPLSFVKARRSINEIHASDSTKNIYGNSIEIIPADDSATAKMIYIDKNPEFSVLNTEINALSKLNPRRVIVLDEMKNKEFLMRRKLQDAPSTFGPTFAGAAGDLEIVEFLFESSTSRAEVGKMRVRKSDPLVERNHLSTTDKETIMLLPAEFYKVSNIDERGRKTNISRLVPASPNEAGVIAYVDWAQNAIPTVSSPLDFLQVERCFAGSSERLVSNIDHRLSTEGVLNLTLTSTYAASDTSFDCAGWGNIGYFDRIQRTFTFKERISFKEHKKTASENSPLLNIPYEAQKALGFGLFTYNKKVADKYGNTHLEGNEIPLPAVFDISNNKKITYVLTGLPEGTDPNTIALRETITKATQEVIADLNAGFRKALAGTPAAHSSDVIQLVIPKSEKEAGELGDLDKNHIYFVSKPTEYGIIGLGGSHHNPRNGKVESASVYLYGANMLSMVQNIRLLDKATNEYANQMKPQTKLNSIDETSLSSELSSSASHFANNNFIHNHNQARTSEHHNHLDHLDHFEHDHDHDLDHDQAYANHNLINANTGEYSHQIDLKKSANLLKQLNQSISRKSLNEKGPKAPAHFIENMIANLSNKDQAAVKTFEIARDLNLFNKPKSIELLYNKMLGDRSALHTHEHLKSTDFETPIDRMQKANICIMNRQDSLMHMTESLNESARKMTDLELLAAIWKPTLAHEIGHNLGLRHNFIASYDKPNWTESNTDTSKRTYSSVMDYLTDDHMTYDGLGPYDIAALRAAYSGMIELHPQIKQHIKSENGKKHIISAAGVKTDVFGNGLVKISDIPKATAATNESWIDFSKKNLAALPIKPFSFCSDEDASKMTPGCSLFDKGTTPLEVVTHQINSYRQFYSLRNFANDRLVFTSLTSGSYIGRLFSIMLPIRQYLEETIYQAMVLGADQATIENHLNAAITGLFFFHEVLRTPDAPAFIKAEDRFEDIELDVPNPSKPGEVIRTIVRIERKWINDLASSQDSKRLSVRGIEFDKVISLIMLTDKNIGFPRYADSSLALSFPDLEQLLIGADSPTSLPTIALLTELLSDNLGSQPFSPIVGMVPQSPMHMKSSVTELMRMYGIIGSMVNLDTVGVQTSSNLSRAFRIASGWQAPKELPSVTLPGSVHDLQYYPLGNADAAKLLVKQGATYATLKASAEATQKLIAEYLTLSLSLNKAPNNEEGKKRLLALTEEINSMLAKMDDTVGVKDIRILGQLGLQILNESLQILELQPKVPQAELMPMIDGLSTTLENISKNVPSVNLLLGALLTEGLTNPVLSSVINAQAIESRENTLYGNSQILSDIFLTLHPRYMIR